MSKFKKGNVPWNKGKKWSKETKKKIGKALKGKIAWNKDTKGICKSNSGSFKKGENHIFWKGGRYKSNNRWYIFKPNHPSAYTTKHILQSRLIAEKCLGRYLSSKEQIHHIDGNSLNDNPKNLYLFPSCSKHTSYEKLKNKLILTSNLIN